MQLTQTIVIILLVLIGIILFVVLLVELINVPQPLVVPFTDGTIIKIKSLANNLYLKPIACSSIFSCNSPSINNYCSAGSNNNATIISAIGQVDDPTTNWQLCQYSSIADTGQAKYLIYSQTNQNLFYMTVNQGILSLEQAPNICIGLKTVPLICNTTLTIQEYFSFVLNEKSLTPGNTTSGSYNIVAACAAQGNSFVYSNGQGAISLPAETCPPLIVSQLTQGENCPSPDVDPRCSLSYLFAIEVQS